MKRYAWSVVAGLALAFAGASSASANIGLPLPNEPTGQVVEQQKNDADVDHEQKNVNIASPPMAIAILGSSKAENEQTNVNVSGTEIEQDNDVEQTSGGGCCGQSQTGQQSVGEQRNDADVDHEQENWNVASPPVAIAVLGHAEASNEEKNVNHSTTYIDQENEVEQRGNGGCCHGRSQTGRQSVGEQRNDADVDHEQKNVNLLSPPIAVAVLGYSKAENEQTNVNYSKTVIDQENEVEQKARRSGHECCKPAPSCSERCKPKKKSYGSHSPEKHSGSCCGSGGEQSVGKQQNDADVHHEQKNVNLLSPPIAVAVLGYSKAENEQTNVNYSKTVIDQENEVEQKPSTRTVVDACRGLIYR